MKEKTLVRNCCWKNYFKKSCWKSLGQKNEVKKMLVQKSFSLKKFWQKKYWSNIFWWFLIKVLVPPSLRNRVKCHVWLGKGGSNSQPYSSIYILSLILQIGLKPLKSSCGWYSACFILPRLLWSESNFIANTAKLDMDLGWAWQYFISRQVIHFPTLCPWW